MTRQYEKSTNSLTEFNDIWYKIFLYCLGSILFVHCVGALVALCSLHKHRYGRYLPIIIALFGFLYPVTGGIITSCFIAWIYEAAGYPIEVRQCAIYGAGQAFLLVVVSFIRLYGTL